MDLQLDTEIRNVLKLVRSSLRTNGTPLENAIRELRSVAESIQNAKHLHRTQPVPDEKNDKYASDVNKQFNEMKQQLDNNSKYLKGLRTKLKKTPKRSTKLQSNKLWQPQKPVIPARKALKHRSPIKRNSDVEGRKSTRLERTKRQLEKENVSALTAATPPEIPVAGPSNNTAFLAGHFPIVEDENFDLETEEIMIDHLKSDRVLRRFKEFLKSGHENSWFCVEDIAKYGYSFGSWNDNICEDGEHDGVRCRQVKITVVDSKRRLCFKRDERVSPSFWRGGWDVNGADNW
ncbi:hypothetical protein FACUT_2642 [Fusarium acutatum]|uniref:Uncharacterized protein n=1 Tax=Fusarium acutatum TaxID=78861 RepID=A0A8H4NQJ9_9HYPO|nr:hypothetical protein FACUT_2642 [Fusarium acutatum]